MDATAADKAVPVPAQKDVEIGSEEIAGVHIDPDIQRRALRKFDFFILPQIMIISIIGYMDRSNMGKDQLSQRTPSILPKLIRSPFFAFR